MIRNLSIFRKGLILVGLPLLTQLGLVAVLFWGRAVHAEALKWALHSKDVIAETEALYADLTEMRSAARGGAIGEGDAAYVTFAEAGESLRDRLDKMPARVADNPVQTARIAAVTAKSQGLTDGFAEVLRLSREGKPGESVAHLRTLKAQQRLAEIRSELNEFLGVEKALDADRLRALDRVNRLQAWGLVLGVVLALVSTAVLLYAFAVGLGNRISVLRANAKRLVEGGALAEPLAGHDEIAELDRAFHEMAEALRQRDRENEMFVYSVSHDLRSPLVNLQGFGQELAAVAGDLRGLLDDPSVPAAVRDRGIRLVDRDMAESLHFIHAAVGRLSTIIDALLRLSRAGRVEYTLADLDANDIARRVVRALADTLEKKGASVEVADLPPCRGDAAAVEQVFANLVGNAVNYLKPGTPGRVEIGAGVADGGPVVYHIRDNGLGIPEAHLPKLFSAFQRLHPEAGPGEGIGLALVRRAVERHGGKIWVESEPGVGTTFFFTLPAAL